MPGSDASALVTTLVLTVVIDLVMVAEVGMILAAFLFIKQVSGTTEVSRVTTHDELEQTEHLAKGEEISEGVLVY